jgi:hypothetical protein
MKLRQITPERIRQWQTDLNARSPDQAAKAYRLLRAILNTALADGLIGRNPWTIRGAGIEQPAKARCSTRPRFSSYPKRSRPGSDASCSSATSRACEAANCLDSSTGTSTRSTAQWQWSAKPMSSSDWVGSSLPPSRKPAAARSALPTFVLHALEHHLKDYAAAPADSFVFTLHTGLPLRRQDMSHAWTNACAVVGFEGVHPHDLRHYAATVIA